MIEARYDLRHRIAAFDYLYWQAMAKAKGAERIVFGIAQPSQSKWNADEVMRRFRSIIEPAPALIGLPYRIGSGGNGAFASHLIRDLVDHSRAGRPVPLLRSVLPPRAVRYTVTIRDDKRAEAQHRNSDIEAWRRFAAEIGATVFEDYRHQDVHLHERMAVYAGAEMNWGVVNGPMHLCAMGGLPYRMFRANRDGPNLAKHHLPANSQYPWTRQPQQALVWVDDTYDNLMREFEAWRNHVDRVES